MCTSVCPLITGHLSLTDYRNLTSDPDSASRHLYLSRQDQQVSFVVAGPGALPGPAASSSGKCRASRRGGTTGKCTHLTIQ